MLSDKCKSDDDIALIERTGVFKEEIITDDDKLAEIFNKFFSGAVKSLDINYYEYFSWDCIFSENEDPILKAIEKYSKHPSILKIKEHHPQNTIFTFIPTNHADVLKEVRNLDESKSSPIESIPARVLKDISDVFVPKMVIDFNTAISTGVFPSTAKLADVVPLFKKRSKAIQGKL